MSNNKGEFPGLNNKISPASSEETTFGVAFKKLEKEKGIKREELLQPIKKEENKSDKPTEKRRLGDKALIKEDVEKIMAALGMQGKELSAGDFNFPELKEYRRKLMELFPEGLTVRGRIVKDESGKWICKNNSNLEGNACLFFFKYILGFNKRMGEEEGKFINKTHYVYPGDYVHSALNLDTSWGIHGTEMQADFGLNDKGKLDLAVFLGAIDHHAKDSPRASSVFELLVEQHYRDGILREIPVDHKALKEMAKFVTAVDSFQIPKVVNLQNIWRTSERTLFSLCVNHQYSAKPEKLFEFFKTNRFEDAFSPLSDKEIKDIFGEPVDEKTGKKINFIEQQNKIKAKAEKFLEQQRGFSIYSPQYGKILVILNEQLPGGFLACLGHGYDGLLIWQPENKSFFFNVRPEKTIPYSLYEELGKEQAVWVRGAMLLQPEWRSQRLGLEKIGFSLLDLLAKLKVPPRLLPPYVKNKFINADEKTI